MFGSKVWFSVCKYLVDPKCGSSTVVKKLIAEHPREYNYQVLRNYVKTENGLNRLQFNHVQKNNIHTSCIQCGNKKLFKKFASKTKKKFWYESPTLGSKLMCKPSSLEAVLKRTSSPQKGSREDSIRMRTLNTILYKAITDLISTYEVSPQLYDLGVEISKVSLPLDFSSCRVYWKISGKSEKDDLIQQVLEKSAPRIRYLLITRQVLGSVPPVTFIKDKQYAAISEVEKLLEAADFGPQESTGDTVSVVNDRRETSISSNLFGIDHEALNRQIMEHKKRFTEKLTEPIDSSLTQQQQELLAEIRKKKIIKKKKAKYNFDDDITPETYLLEKYNQEKYTEERDQLEDQLDESEVKEMTQEDGQTR
ncbi:putative ribosome-binding factor A, mitochondrial [Acipenser oxyrinchus oxyrinchus]|uniref:Ribosome-binding factor A, mitochondrial n=1 Tax=Acipenser oxyrinchus oxyrinchus TaxID=40147 RepID=A0AAD8GFQ1_ACIOX|nr:putative ribosome-binding factor A, mitochondrial [Acipenser oxyrinchus oxyrinchus]